MKGSMKAAKATPDSRESVCHDNERRLMKQTLLALSLAIVMHPAPAAAQIIDEAVHETKAVPDD